MVLATPPLRSARRIVVPVLQYRWVALAASPSGVEPVGMNVVGSEPSMAARPMPLVSTQ